MGSSTRVRTLLFRKKTLLRGATQGDSGWIWTPSTKVSVSINGIFNATVTIYTDNADESGPTQPTGSILGTTTVPATFASEYIVNWVKVAISDYVSGGVDADLMGGP